MPGVSLDSSGVVVYLRVYWVPKVGLGLPRFLVPLDPDPVDQFGVS